MIDMRESTTAKLCSFARAYHSNFGREKIIDDYLAYDLMGREEYEQIGLLIQNDFNLADYDDGNSFDGRLVYPAMDRYITPVLLFRIAFTEKELQKFRKDIII